MRPLISRLVRPGILGVLSIFFGLISFWLISLATRWLVFLTGGVLLSAASVLFGLETTLTVGFVVGLSVDAHYFLTTPLPPLWTGLTTPGALSVPLALVPGLLLLGRRTFLNRTVGIGVDWAREISVPMAWYVVTSLASIALSTIRFAGLCAVWQNLALFALFVITLNVVRSRREAIFIVDLLLVTLIGQCLVFFFEIATGVKFNAVGKIQAVATEGATVWHSASGTAAVTTAGFAMFLDPLVMLAYALYRTQHTSRRKRIYGAVFLLGATVLALTLNRSTWLAMPLGGIVAEVLLRRRGLVEQGEKRYRGLFLPIAALGIFVLVAPMFQSVRKANHEEDFQQRLDLMGPAGAMIKRNPVVGVGPGVYGYVLREYAAGHAGWLFIAHNDYLLIWAERGTLGLVAWLLFLRAVGREFNATSRRRDRWDATIGVGAVAGFVMQLWEVFWTSGMSFPGYGVMYLILGVCAGLNRHLAIEASARDPMPAAEPLWPEQRRVAVIPAAR